MKRIVLWALAVGLVSWTATGKAEEKSGIQWYGQGMYLYFSGDYPGAIAAYDEAIQAGFEDPRPYYFRGMTKYATGDQAGGHTDLVRGADLEAADPSMFTLVNRAVERIQGEMRKELEGYRKAGRARAIVQRAKEEEARYGRLQSADPEVLLVPPKAGRLTGDSDPFSDEPGQLAGGKAAPMPKAKPAPPVIVSEPEPENTPDNTPPPVVSTPPATTPPATTPPATTPEPPKVDTPPPAAENPPVAEVDGNANTSRLFDFLTRPLRKGVSDVGGQIGNAVPPGVLPGTPAPPPEE